jgi:ribulose-5-phosphate 4-epimerase/fuculose-1-phosphate aldolase
VDELGMRTAVAKTAVMMSDAGLAEGFGHVSARFREGFIITTVDPLGTASADSVIVVANAASAPSGGGGAPLETPMHAQIYMARPDVHAICRGHPESVVVWGVGTEELPLFHGLGGLAGVRVGIHDDVDLITSADQGSAVAASLGIDMSVILRANGCLSTGASLLEALTRLYFLEERARVAIAIDDSATPIDWGGRLRHTAPELPRAMAWMQAAFSDE